MKVVLIKKTSRDFKDASICAIIGKKAAVGAVETHCSLVSRKSVVIGGAPS
jgi:hypothetical protein